MNQTNISQRASRQPQQRPASPVIRSQPGLFILFFLLIAGLSMVAAPGVTWANFGTVPPLPEVPPTILVGPVDHVSDDGALITVAGVAVRRGTDTRIDERVGPLVVGSWARVYGYGEDSEEGVLQAVRIKVLPRLPLVKLIGPLDTLNETELTVDGILVLRSATTLVAGNPVAGEDRVSVRAAIQSDGRLLALHVVKINPIRDDDDDDDTDEDRPGHTHLTGVINSMPENGLRGTWNVSGIEVEVTDDTKLRARVGLLVEGGWVKIKGQARDGKIIADHLHTTRTKHFLHLTGNLTSITQNDTENTVTVDGITVNLSPTAKIQGNPQPGNRVKVKGLDEAGSFLAVLVQARGRRDGPPPLETPGLVVRFTGVVDELPPTGFYGQWKIAGNPVTVPPGAFIDEHKGSVAEGAFVEVTALLGPNGSLTAVLIAVTRSANGDDNDDDRGEWVEFHGTIDSLPSENGETLIGEWTVDGKHVQVSDQTEIKLNGQTVALGKKVKVAGWRQDDDSVRAARIELVEESGRYTRFAGVIQSLPENTLMGEWEIDDRRVMVSEATELKDRHGDFAVGQRVKVHGREQGGVVQAEKIEVLPAPEVRYSGRIISFPPGLTGEWMVGTKKVIANDQTEFKQDHGAFAEGLLVKVKGRFQGDGSILANKIEVLPLPKIEHRGEILELPADGNLVGLWRIGRYVFDVTSNTELEDDLDEYALGVTVKAKGRQRADGVVVAEEIEIASHRHHHDDDDGD